MAETVNQGIQAGNPAAGTQNGQGGAGTAPRVFTQAEVDAIVGDRLSRERAKYADYDAIRAKAEQFDAAEAANQTELQRAQNSANQYKAELDAMKKANAARDARDKVAAEKKVPANLLTGETEEDCRAQADAILAFAQPQQPQGYPVLPDGGEVQNGPTTNTRDKFALWAQSQNF